MHPSKYIWGLRALLYKPFFGCIGHMSYMGKPCFIEGSKRIIIGKKTRIFPGIRMEAIGSGRIIIGDNCAIEQNVHITSMGSDLIVENNVTIAANTFITNLNHEYKDINKSVMDQGHKLIETRIGEGCFLGYGVAVQAGTILGKHCVVGTNSVVKGIFPDYCVLIGCPARIVKIYNCQTGEWERYGQADKEYG